MKLTVKGRDTLLAAAALVLLLVGFWWEAQTWGL